MSFFIVTSQKTTLVHGSRICDILEVTSFWAHLFCVFSRLFWAWVSGRTTLLLGKYRTLSGTKLLNFSPFSGAEDSEQVLYYCALFPAQLASIILYL